MTASTIRHAFAVLLLLGACTLGGDEEITPLVQKAAEGNLDALSRQKLASYRQKAQEQRLDALKSLGLGLQACLDGKMLAARKSFQEAMQSPAVVELANARLPRRLDQVVAALPQRDLPLPAKGQVCAQCGGTGKADCPDCQGTGGQICKKCQGHGSYKESSMYSSTTYRSPCSTCNYKGEIKCRECMGTGLVPCKCGATGKGDDAGDKSAPSRPFSSEETASVRYVIFLSQQLAAGAVDLYTPQSLKPTPVIKLPVQPPGQK